MLTHEHNRKASQTRDASAKLMTRFGPEPPRPGSYLGTPSTTYEAGVKERIVVVEFPTVQGAIKCHDSEAYQATLKALDNAAERDLRIANGIAAGLDACRTFTLDSPRSTLAFADTQLLCQQNDGERASVSAIARGAKSRCQAPENRGMFDAAEHAQCRKRRIK